MIRLATQADFVYISSHADRSPKDLGWLPSSAYRQAIDQAQIWIQEQAGDRIGYWYAGHFHNRLRVYQAYTQHDARREHHATEFARYIEQQSNSCAIERITCHCVHDLPANAFWKAIDWKAITIRPVTRGHARVAIEYEHVTPCGLAVEAEFQRRKPAEDKQKLLEMFGLQKRVAARILDEIRAGK